MIPYKGTRAGNLRQYIANKPDKWGFKFFALASTDGVIYDILPYQGSTTFENLNTNLTSTENNMNLSSKVVIALVKSMTSIEGSIIYVDNFFSSYNLVKYLREELGCFYTGTVRENRSGNPTLRATSDLNKNPVKRGTLDYVSNDGILCAKWKDNKIVSIISSSTGMEPLSSVNRCDKSSKSKKEIVCPLVLKQYNNSMGGVDKSDILGHL